MSVTNIARTATRSMRIIALPLTPHRQVNGKPVEHLTYYHFVTPPDSKNANSWAQWPVAKASDVWAGLGKAPEGTWKVSTVLGHRLDMGSSCRLANLRCSMLHYHCVT